MSCFVVSDNHINKIVNYALAKSMWTSSYGKTDHHNVVQIAQILVDENVRSYNYRYGEEGTPHKINYKYDYNDLSPVEFLKLCQSLEYQSCETDNWKESKAYQILDYFIQSAIGHLEGYDRAEWAI